MAMIKKICSSRTTLFNGNVINVTFRTNFESTFSFAQIFNGTLGTDTYMLNFKFWNVIVYTHFVD